MTPGLANKEFPRTGQAVRAGRCFDDMGMKRWVNLLCILGTLVFIGLHFKPALLLNAHIIAGGDTPSHYGLAHFITSGNPFFGWVPGNFAGFPAFQFYPPLSFVLIVLADLLTSLPIAFKLILVLGTFLLPIACFICLHQMNFSFPAPALGAIFSLFFLFNEGNSMWGANIPSTLAGEFSYSLGFAVGIILLGTLCKTVSTGKGWRGLVVLIALLGLTHGYPFLFFILASSFFLLVCHPLGRTLSIFARMYVQSFLLMGFWLVPALVFLNYTTPFNFVWRFESLLEFIPPIFFPLLILLGASQAYLLIKRKIDIRMIFLWYGVLTAVLGYLVGFHLGLVDIRFLPFAQVFLVLAAAAGLGEILKPLRGTALLLTGILILTLVWVSGQVHHIDTWIPYNLKGFQDKPLWKEFQSVNTFLHGDVSDPRVVYEHSPVHEAAGTIRAFENLPLFSGRSTLEGLYMQSSINAPLAYHIQSEVSAFGSHPFMHYSYPRFDLNRAEHHLKLFNVSHFLTITADTKQSALEAPGYELETEIPPYAVFRVIKNEDRYVVPLNYKPVFVSQKDWKRIFFDWFRRSTTQVFLIASGDDNIPYGYQALPSNCPDISRLPQEPLEPEVKVVEQVHAQEILITTSRVGHPLLVKVSYHPNWHVEGAERVYLASPGFMIIFPTRSSVRLHFSPGLIQRIGLACSGLGILLLIVPFRVLPPLSTLKTKWRWLAALVLIAALSVWGISHHYDAHILHRRGLDRFLHQDYEEARKYFQRNIREFPLSPAVDESYLYAGLCFFKTEEWEKAAAVWEEYLSEFPEGRTVDEVLYHLGLGYQALGQDQKASEAFAELRSKFPESRFSALVQ